MRSCAINLVPATLTVLPSLQRTTLPLLLQRLVYLYVNKFKRDVAPFSKDYTSPGLMIGPCMDDEVVCHVTLLATRLSGQLAKDK